MKNINTNKLNYTIMKTSTLKKAILQNKRTWTTTITWATILEDSEHADNVGKTVITIEQKFYKNQKDSYERTEIFNHHEFDKAYNEFHNLLKNWI